MTIRNIPIIPHSKEMTLASMLQSPFIETNEAYQALIAKAMEDL